MITVGQKTFRLDLFRSSLNGVLEIGFNVFVVLIAIRFLDASETCKSFLAAGSAIGFFIMPWTVRISAILNRPVTHFAGFLMLICAVSLFCCSQVNTVNLYTFYLVVAQIALSQMPGLLIHVYSSNYEPDKRGQNISWNFICASIVGIVFSYGFGLYLDNYKSYNFLFFVMGFVSLLSSVALFLMPSNKPAVVGVPSMLGGLSFIIKDSLFGKMLLGWMLMGLGVIMTIPLRIEYMAGEGGIGISNQEVAMVVISYSIAGILSSRLWGKLFDRIPFVPYRISLNLFLFASVLLFFTANSFYGLILGSVLAGVANGGASIAWSLWVTKLAPIGLESEYMGAHMFLTGVRGFCAPFLGYTVLNMLDFKGVAYTSSILILCSLLIFCTALKAERLSN